MSVCEYLFLQLKGNSFIHIEKSPENWCARRFFDCSVNLVLRLFIKPAFCESTFHFSLIVVKIILCTAVFADRKLVCLRIFLGKRRKSIVCTVINLIIQYGHEDVYRQKKRKNAYKIFHNNPHFYYGTSWSDVAFFLYLVYNTINMNVKLTL